MFRTLTSLESMSIRAADGNIGSVQDTYFDDQAWTLRYLVVDTAKWLPGRKVLVSPISVQAIDWRWRTVALDLTREQIKGSPKIESHLPVSRQHETAYLDYFGYPHYWTGPLRWGPVPLPPSAGSAVRTGPNDWWEQRRRALPQPGDPHLRSAKALAGYHIEAADGSIGRAQDFLFDEQNWSLRFLAVDTHSWWPGRHVLVAIDWIESVNWGERKVHVSMTREAIERAPAWHPELALVADDEDYLDDGGANTPDTPPNHSGRVH
jgi:uncharacterized protein YrrD